MLEFVESEADSLEMTRKHLIDSIQVPIIALLVIWVFHVVQVITGMDWGIWGIFPRYIWGIGGIATGPLIHGSWGHLMSNSLPLFVLLTICFFFYRKVALRAFWMIYFLCGLMVWIMARSVYHIGASGVVYGLVAFIFWNGIFRRSLRSIILALVVLVVYSGMFEGISPDQEGVSWESHLLGSLSGIFVSFFFKGELEEDEAENRYRENDEFAEKQYFLPRDAFDKTKQQRIAEALEAQQLLEAELSEKAAENQEVFYPPFWNSSTSF